MSFSFELERNGKFSFLDFLDIEVSREKRKLATTVYRKPTFGSVYTRFEEFLSTVNKLVWFILWLLIVSKFVLTGKSFTKN